MLFMKKREGIPSAAAMVPLLVADVFQLAGAFRQWGDTIAAVAGQTQARWQVLSAASAGDRTVAQLARRLGYARQSVQRTADLLVADGLAEYAMNVDHVRSPHLRLTPSGLDTLQTLTKAAQRYHASIAKGMDPKEVQTTIDTLRT